MLKSISLVICILFTIFTASIAVITKGRIDTLQNTLTKTKGDLEFTKGVLATTQATLKTTQGELAEAKTKIDEQITQIGDLTKNLADANKTVEDQKTQLAEVQKNFDDKAAELAALQVIMGNLKPEELKAQVTGMTEQIKSLQHEVEEAHVMQASLEQQRKDAEGKVATANKQIAHYQQEITLHSFQGRVVAVNPGWNFVVIDVGDRQGATINAPLVVTRGGQNIAKARITSVEPSTSIADIIPSSLAKGQSVQPGDQVVFAGKLGRDSQVGVPSDTAPKADSLIH